MIKNIVLFSFTVTLLFSQELITPVPIITQFDKNKVNLGKKLFFDKRLSANDTVACSNCHLLEDGGDDNLPVSFGILAKKGMRNSPTLFNSRYNSIQFWDGRAKNLHEQIDGPIHDPVEMGTNFKDIIFKLNKDKQYQKDFLAIYDDGITKKNIVDALVSFENILTTPNSKIDKFLQGDTSALSKDEQEGFALFKEHGCISCHNGINIGGNLMQRIGVVENFNTVDFGKYNVTKDDKDKFYFKVPSLRNVELTAPYFHNGKVKTLKEAVEKMAKYQIGYLLEEKDIQNIVKFLKTTTGQIPKNIKDINEKTDN